MAFKKMATMATGGQHLDQKAEWPQEPQGTLEGFFQHITAQAVPDKKSHAEATQRQDPVGHDVVHIVQPTFEPWGAGGIFSNSCGKPQKQNEQAGCDGCTDALPSKFINQESTRHFQERNGAGQGGEEQQSKEQHAPNGPAGQLFELR